MAQLKAGIVIEADSIEKVKEIGGLVQATVKVVDQNDLTRLLRAVTKNPGIVKKALNFL